MVILSGGSAKNAGAKELVDLPSLAHINVYYINIE
jgi:hypothetical protein